MLTSDTSDTRADAPCTSEMKLSSVISKKHLELLCHSLLGDLLPLDKHSLKNISICMCIYLKALFGWVSRPGLKSSKAPAQV